MRTLPEPYLCVLLLGGAFLPSGAAGQEPLPLLDEYHIRVFTVADGLAASDIRVVTQDDDGYLYAGGGRGLARFDGRAFTVIPLDGFRTTLLEQMVRDPAGRVWLLSRGNDIGYIADHRFHALPPPPVPVGTITHTSDGLTWFGSQRGLVRVDPEAEEPYTLFTREDGLPSDTTTGLFELQDGQRVVVTVGGLARPVGGGSAGPDGFEPVGPRLRIDMGTAVAHADTSGLWIGMRKGALRYREGRLTEYRNADARVLALDDLAWRTGESALLHWLTHRVDLGSALPEGLPSTPRRILGARDGTRWIVVFTERQGGGRSRLLRERDGRFEVMDLRSYLEFRNIHRVFEDHEGGIWIGTDRGLIQLSPRRVAALTRRHALRDGFTTAILQARDHALWVGSFGGGLHRFADGRVQAWSVTVEGHPMNHIRSLREASDGTIWVGARGGLAAMGKDGPRRVLEGVEVRSILETRGPDGVSTLWVADGDRLMMGRPSLAEATAGVASGWRFTEFRPGFAGGVIWLLSQDAQGEVWVGGEGGLFRVVGDSVRRMEPPGGSSAEFVFAREEPDGTLWFGTYEHGLFRYRDGRFARLTTAEGLHHDGIWSMLEDSMGGAWMSSDVGVFRLPLARLHEAADAVEGGRAPLPLSPLVFTESEGLPSRECNRASPAAWRLRDGRLVFNNIAGAVVIDPARAIRSPPPTRTVLQAVLGDGRRLAGAPGEPVRLPAGTRHLDFEFAALSFATPEQNRYRYRLDGFDHAWVRAHDRRASYAGLPPGRYTFRVQSATGAGEWSETAATRALVVPALFWQTWWFRGLLLCTLAGLLTSAYRYRVARLLEVERLRVRIASDLHDDVGSNLSSIALLSEMLRDRAGENRLDRRQLERISRAAAETIGALREIIWLVDPKHDNAADLVRRMRGTAAAMLNGTASEFQVSEPLPTRRLEPLLLRQIFLIYKEALHNVVKHAEARRVRTRVAFVDGEVRLSVEDDGRGFAEEDVRPGQGLQSMRHRAGEVGGTVEVQSGPGEGTRITFRVEMA